MKARVPSHLPPCSCRAGAVDLGGGKRTDTGTLTVRVEVLNTVGKRFMASF